MKKTIHAILLLLVLAMPTLAQAMPCKMSMSAPAVHEMQDDASAEPCPHMKAKEPCESLMSIGECLDIDKITTTDASSSKLLKSDLVPSVAILATLPHHEVNLSQQSARAPPEYDGTRVPNISLILTTQRFRV